MLQGYFSSYFTLSFLKIIIVYSNGQNIGGALFLITTENLLLCDNVSVVFAFKRKRAIIGKFIKNKESNR